MRSSAWRRALPGAPRARGGSGGLGRPRAARAAAAAAVLAGLLGAGRATASPRDWLGSAACGRCHPAELAAWQATAHARTRDRFADAPPTGRCLACHGTGDAPAGPAAVEVGCEACHGPGEAYGEDDLMRDGPLARRLGLVVPTRADERAALCARCHGRPTGRTPFDPTAPVHPVPAAPAAARRGAVDGAQAALAWRTAPRASAPAPWTAPGRASTGPLPADLRPVRTSPSPPGRPR